MTEFEFEVFDWKKQDDFCADCGRKIGKWAKKHSGKCQSCNLKDRMKNLKGKLQRVSQ
jgi:DNA-directed RNA polymerase subunit RPC12/RpoP